MQFKLLLVLQTVQHNSTFDAVIKGSALRWPFFVYEIKLLIVSAGGCMNYKIVSQGDFDFVTLDEAKAQCRLMPSFTLDDDEIYAFIIAASDMAQQYLNLLLTEGNVLQYVDSYCDEFLLFGGEVTVINSVKASLDDGEVTIPDTDYTLNPVTGNLVVSSAYFAYTEWFIDFDCGYSDLARPMAIKHAILRTIATMYNHREDVSVGLSVAKMPLTSKIILKMYRRYVS